MCFADSLKELEIPAEELEEDARIRFKLDVIEEVDEDATFVKEINNYISLILADPQIESATYKLIATIPSDCIWNFNNYLGLRIQYIDRWCGTLNKVYREFAKNYVCFLEDFSKVLSKRYNIAPEYIKEVTWDVFNHFLFKKGAENWLKICVTGPIKEETIEEYLHKCFIDDMISLYNQESLALFMFYICNLASEKNELIACRVLPRYSEREALTELLTEYKDDKTATVLESKLFSDETANNSAKIRYTIDDIDLMTGVEFEELITKLFINMGYSAYMTKASGDQGIDVIAEKNGIKYGIQAKCYSGSVGNSAVQEATAGKQFYGCDKVIVITNNCFTKSAIKLADANGVILWDRYILSEKLVYLL